MQEPDRFIPNLERTVRTQLNSQKVGYLVGAGASFLNGHEEPGVKSALDSCSEFIGSKGTL